MWVLLGLMLLIAVVIGGLRVIAEKGRPAVAQRTLLFEKASPLFSPAERSFYGVLEQAIGDDYRIFAKVRLGDVIQPQKGADRSRYVTALNKINKKHLDYVVCGKTDFVAIGAIELDDKSHNRRDRQNRDAFVDEALESAGIPIIHFSCRTTYSVQDVRVNIANAFSLTPNGVREKGPSVEDAQSTAKIASKEFRLETEEDSVAAPVSTKEKGQKNKLPDEICPDCDTKMVVRKMSTGPHVGRMFWVCSNYPKCKSIKTIGWETAEAMDF